MSKTIDKKHNGKEEKEYRMGHGVEVSSKKNKSSDNNHCNNSTNMFMFNALPFKAFTQFLF